MALGQRLAAGRKPPGLCGVFIRGFPPNKKTTRQRDKTRQTLRYGCHIVKGEATPTVQAIHTSPYGATEITRRCPPHVFQSRQTLRYGCRIAKGEAAPTVQAIPY
jgi:hypothetical protein